MLQIVCLLGRITNNNDCVRGGVKSHIKQDASNKTKSQVPWTATHWHQSKLHGHSTKLVSYVQSKQEEWINSYAIVGENSIFSKHWCTQIYLTNKIVNTTPSNN